MRYPTPARWRVRIDTVHDGDTLNVVTDRGFDDYTTMSIRLLDVWAPELRDVGGRETRDYVLGWVLDHHDGTGWPFLLETFRTPRSDVDVKTFDRYVGVVSAADGARLNDDVTGFVTAAGYGQGTT